MGQIGISLYPEQTTVAKATAYLEMAHQLGYRRLFTSLLQLSGEKGRDQLAILRLLLPKQLNLDLKRLSILHHRYFPS